MARRELHWSLEGSRLDSQYKWLMQYIRPVKNFFSSGYHEFEHRLADTLHNESSSDDRINKLLPRDIIFCSKLLDSHGENYTAMVNDPRNIYKDGIRSIQRKMRIFKESPHYETYLRAKDEGKAIEDALADEGHM